MELFSREIIENCNSLKNIFAQGTFKTCISGIKEIAAAESGCLPPYVGLRLHVSTFADSEKI